MTYQKDSKYDDIIDLPHHVSSTRAQMPMIGRAAQFSPFAALTGYDAAIRETGRLTHQRVELSEEQLVILDRKQQILLENISAQPTVSVTYFVPDTRKAGGTYVTVNGNLKRVNSCRRLMILTDGIQIPLDEVIEIESSLFCEAIWTE